MQLRTRVTLGSLFAASAVLSTVLAWHAQRQHVATPVTPPAPSSQQQLADVEPYCGDREAEAEAAGPDAPGAILDHLELGWMPKGYVRDVDHDKTMELAQLVEGWATGDSDEPRIEYRKGVVFARSAEDRGDDGPYPRSAAPQDMHVCGEASTWLRASLQKRLANEVLTCDRNVCSYSGSEYSPDGYLVFHELAGDGKTQWALDAWIEIYRAGVNADDAARNQADVVKALRHELGASCAGEPAGTY